MLVMHNNCTYLVPNQCNRPLIFYPGVLATYHPFPVPRVKEYTNFDRPYFLAYIASNCQPIRDHVYKLFREYSPTAHSLGRCLTTPGLQAPGSWGHLGEFFSQYRFGLVMENSDIPGYISQRILTAYLGGAIPVSFTALSLAS